MSTTYRAVVCWGLRVDIDCDTQLLMEAKFDVYCMGGDQDVVICPNGTDKLLGIEDNDIKLVALIPEFEPRKQDIELLNEIKDEYKLGDIEPNLYLVLDWY